MSTEDTYASPALIASEERMRLALEAAGMGSFVWYPQEDRAVADSRLFDLLGVPRDGAISLADALSERIHPDDTDIYAKAVGRSIDPDGDGRLREEVRFIYPDGSLHWILITAHVQFEGSPAVATQMAGVGVEITRRKLAELSNFYSAELDSTIRPLGDVQEIQMAAVELLGQHLSVDRCFYSEISANGDIAFVSCEYKADGLAPTPSSFTLASFGPTLLDRMRLGDSLVIENIDNEPSLTEEQRASYLEFGLQSSISVPLVKAGKWVAILSIVDHVPHIWSAHQIALVEHTAERTWASVERARIESALQESEERLNLALEGVPMLWWEVDAVTRAVKISPIYALVFGIPDAYVPGDIGAAIASLIHEDDRPLFAAALERTLLEGEDFLLEYRLVHPDTGAIIWVESVAKLHRPGGGRSDRIVGVARVITDRKDAEKARFELEQSQRIALRRAELVDLTVTELQQPGTLDNVAIVFLM